jgi:hypothetical protein
MRASLRERRSDLAAAALSCHVRPWSAKRPGAADPNEGAGQSGAPRWNAAPAQRVFQLLPHALRQEEDPMTVLAVLEHLRQSWESSSHRRDRSLCCTSSLEPAGECTRTSKLAVLVERARELSAAALRRKGSAPSRSTKTAGLGSVGVWSPPTSTASASLPSIGIGGRGDQASLSRSRWLGFSDQRQRARLGR